MATEQSKPQAQELQEWIDAEIAKASDDGSILSQMVFHQRAHPSHESSSELPFALACCCNMISKQREEAIRENEKKLERSKERLDSLRLAQAFKFESSFSELNIVFGAPCTIDVQEGWDSSLFREREMPPIVQWSTSICTTSDHSVARALEAMVRIDFLLVLSKRTLVVRHNILKEGKVIAFSSVELPYLCSIRVSRWPEIILFVFEHNGEQRYLHFSPRGLGGLFRGQISCFLM